MVLKQLHYKKSSIDQASGLPAEGPNITLLYPLLIRYASSPYLGDKEGGNERGGALSTHSPRETILCP